MMSDHFFRVAVVNSFIILALGSSLQNEAQTRQATQKESRRLGQRTSIPVDHDMLRVAEKNSEEAYFTHGKEFLQALSRGDAEFEVVDSKLGTVEPSEHNGYDGMKKSILYNSLTSYSLHSDSSVYVNFDDLEHISSFGSVHELGDAHVIQCGKEQSIPDGTFLVGSAIGPWAMNSAVEQAVQRSLAHLSPSHLATRIEKGLTVLRKVVRQEEITTSHRGSPEVCSKLHTENVHPLELFSKMKIESASSNPFHYKYDAMISDSMHLSSLQLVPDFPWSCDPSASGSFVPHGSSSPSYSFSIGRTKGCALNSIDDGSYNFNYDPYSDSVSIKSVLLQTGVHCVDCYAYLGSSLLVVVRYGYDYNSFDFEIKSGGNVGFGATIEVQDPTITESRTVVILNPESDFTSVSLGQGLYIRRKFGGLTATLSGSGSAVGSASISTKQALNANATLNYLPSSITTSHSTSGEFNSPVYTSGSFSSGNFNVAVALRGTEDFSLTFSGLLTFNYGSNVVGTITASTVTKTVRTASVSILSKNKTVKPANNIQIQSDLLSASTTYVPGDSIIIEFEYSGFNPSENIFLFYSIHKSERSHAIMQKEFMTSSTGSGTYVSEWLVPWDFNLVGDGLDNTIISIKSSNMIQNIYKSPLFSTSLFTNDDGIFSSPHESAIVPLDQPYLLQWDNNLLSSFQLLHWGSDFGSAITAKEVTLLLIAEKFSADGSTILSVSSHDDLTMGDIPNTGKCTVIFPKSLRDSGDRFHIVVKSADNSEIYGWSKGYFYLDSKPKPKQLMTMSSSEHLKKNLLYNINKFQIKKEVENIIIDEGASSVDTISLTTAFEIGLSANSLYVKGANVLMSASTPSFPLFSPVTVTVDASPVSNPSMSPTEPTMSPSLTPSESTFTPTTAPTMAPSVFSNTTMSPSQQPITFIPSSKQTLSPSQEQATISPSQQTTMSPSKQPIMKSPSQEKTTTSPSRQPTPLPGNPTREPTKQILKSLRVSQNIGISNSTVARSAIFKKAVKNSIAKAVNVDESAVNVTKIAFQAGRKFRTLLASSALVEYDITLVNSDMTITGLQDSLNAAITSGTMTSSIQAYSSTLAGVSADTVVPATGFVDTSPTSSPTPSPSEGKSQKRLSTGQIVGIAIGVGTGVLFAIGVVCYYCSTGGQSTEFPVAQAISK